MHSAVPVVSRRRVQRHAPRLTRAARRAGPLALRVRSAVRANRGVEDTCGGRVNCYCIILLSSLRGRAPAGGAGGSGLVRALIPGFLARFQTALRFRTIAVAESRMRTSGPLRARVHVPVAGRSRTPGVARTALRPVGGGRRHTSASRVSSPGSPACPRACRRARRPPRPGAPEHGPRGRTSAISVLAPPRDRV
jgi:hypothetical protein